MISLDSRGQSILMALLHAGGQATTAELADRLNLTPRMVRYRLDRLNAWVRERGAELQRRPGKGLSIESTCAATNRILAELEGLTGFDLVLTTAQRRGLLVFALLLENQPTIAKELERRLGVSRSTLFKDLDEVSEWFAERELSLIRRPGFGILVEGAERHRREALVEALSHRLGSEGLLFVTCGGDPKDLSSFCPTSLVPSPMVLRFLSSLQIVHGRRAVVAVETLIGAQFSDDTFASLVLHIALLITRIAQDNPVDYACEAVASLTEHPCFSAALQVLGELSRELGLAIPGDEAAFLTSKLIGAKVIRRLRGEAEEEPASIDVASLAEDLARYAASWLGEPRLVDDEQFAQELAGHLESYLQRRCFGLTTLSPLLEDLKDIYPSVYEIADRLREVLAEKIGQEVPEEEAGSLAMYLRAALERLRSFPRYRVLVICPMGAATSHLLASRLASEFPQLDVVDVLSVREFLARPLAEADGIICTVGSLPVQVRGPMIHVSPLLPPADLARVQTWLAAELQDERDSV